MTQVNENTSQMEALKLYLSQVATERNKQAFEALFDHYVPLIRAYSLAREPGADLVADELAQDVMIKLWEKAHTYNPQLANLNTWVFTIARNCRIDKLRRSGRYTTEIDPLPIFERLEDETPGPFQTAQQQRLANSLHSGMAQLPREQVEVLKKVYLEGKSHQQVSDDLKLPLGTIKSRIRLALKKLQLLVRR